MEKLRQWGQVVDLGMPRQLHDSRRLSSEAKYMRRPDGQMDGSEAVEWVELVRPGGWLQKGERSLGTRKFRLLGLIDGLMKHMVFQKGKRMVSGEEFVFF